MALIFGDTAETLGGVTIGLDQVLSGEADVTNYLHGDAEAIVGRAYGGNDMLLGGGTDSAFMRNYLFGDARSLSGHAHGGNDALTPGFASTSAGTVFNELYGDAFSMTDRSVGGDDTLGGAPPSAAGVVQFGDAYAMAARAAGGNDVITGGGAKYGDAYFMSGRTVGGDDTIAGGSYPAEGATGDAQSMTGHARGGDDRIEAAGGWAYGDASTMAGRCVGGDDTLVATTRDRVEFYGDTSVADGAVTFGDDRLVLRGPASSSTNMLVGDCFLVRAGAEGFATAGDDTIVGGAGNDAMWGDWRFKTGDVRGGNDLFIFRKPDIGHDVIEDFRRGEDKIGIKLDAFDLETLLDVEVESDGTNMMVRLSEDDTVLLVGVAELSFADFKLID